MPQQINLFTPIFLTQKRYFSANTMVQALGVFLLLGGVLLAAWMWNIEKLSAGYRQSVSSNQKEIERMQAALAVSKASTGPADAALVQELQKRRNELQQRERILQELQRGLSAEGWGHSARLQLVANSIPSQVWVTEIKADDQRFEIGGFTVEPAALNVWMDRLAASPLLQGQQLSTIQVEKAAIDVRDGAASLSNIAAPGTLGAVRASGPAAWSFKMVSAIGSPAAVKPGGGR